MFMNESNRLTTEPPVGLHLHRYQMELKAWRELHPAPAGDCFSVEDALASLNRRMNYDEAIDN